MNQLRVSEVEDALVAHLQAALPAMKRQIASLTTSEMDAEYDVTVTELPAIRLFFQDGPLSVGTDQTALTYSDAQRFIVLCGAQNMRTKKDERNDALKLMDDVVDKLAGKRLEGLPSHDQRPQIVLKSRGLFQTGPGGTWYAIAISVEAITQYEANSATA